MLVSRPLDSSKSRILAKCQGNFSLGDFVYVSGNIIDNVYSVSKASIQDSTMMPAIGVVVAQIPGGNSLVQISGDVIEQYLSLIPGKTYFLGSNGRPTPTPPTPSAGTYAYLQSLGYALTSTILRLLPNNDIKIRVA